MQSSNAQCSHDSPSSDTGAAVMNIVKDVPENDNLDDLKKELASRIERSDDATYPLFQ